MQRNKFKRARQGFHDRGFRQSHSGRDRFPGGDWGTSSEFGRNSVSTESDPYDRGVDFDRDERDDETLNREYARSRFAEPYTGGQFSRSQYGIGGQFNQDRFDHSSRGYGFSGIGPKGYKKTDGRLLDEACEALYQNPWVDASDIDVNVKDGIITLSGTVESRQEKREAEGCIEHLSGVVDIRNELRPLEKSGGLHV